MLTHQSNYELTMNEPQRRIASCMTCGEEPVAEHNLAAPESHEPADKCPQVGIVRESDKEQHAHAMRDEELCTFITTALAPAKKAIRDNLAYISEAHNRFAQPGRRVPVPGKPTWGKWIQQNLGISDRHVRRLLAEERGAQKTTNGRKQKQEPRVEVESESDTPPPATLQLRQLSAESANDRTTASAAAAPATTHPSLPLPKSGSWLDLANNVIALCGEHFNGALGGLDPHDAASVFGKAAQRLAQTYCLYSYGAAMEMVVTVEYVGPRPPKAANAGQSTYRDVAV